LTVRRVFQIAFESKTRSSAEVWLMGKSTEELSGSHLPTNVDSLDFYFSFTSMVLVMGGGQRSDWEWQKLAVELVRNKPKPV